MGVTVKKPVVYLLCGLAGSGKSTYAHKLAQEGFIKLSLDEEVFNRHGRAGVDYPADEHLKYYEAAKIDLDTYLMELLEQNQSVVLDYGFWRRASRDHYKKLIEALGGTWKLIYFKASPEVLMRRIEERNQRSDANAFLVTTEMLQNFIARLEEPLNENEEVYEQR